MQDTRHDVPIEQAVTLLNTATTHGQRIKQTRGATNTKIDFLLLGRGEEQSLVDFLNDQHLPYLKKQIGLEVKFITFNNVANYKPKMLQTLMNLELILPLNSNGDVLNKEEVANKFADLKN